MPVHEHPSFSSWLATAFSVLIATTGLAQQKYAPRPIPAGPDAPTQKRFQREEGELWHAALVAEARAGNAFRKEWQESATALLDGYGHMAAREQLDAGEASRLLDHVDRLRDLGCDDPVLLLVGGELLQLLDLADRALPMLRKAEGMLEGKQGSLLLRYRLQEALRHQARRDRQQADLQKATGRARDLLVELAAAPEFGVGKERLYYATVVAHFGGEPGRVDEALLDRIDARAGGPVYATLLLRAEIHLAQVQAISRDRPAPLLTQVEIRAANEHLAVAKSTADRAFRAFPGLPEAPVMMMRILGPSNQDRSLLRRCFDLAVAAQFDYEPAYSAYLTYLAPRWGGTRRAVFDFGSECAATGRFDTQVPLFFRSAISILAAGSPDPIALWSAPDVQSVLAKLDEGYRSTATTPRTARALATMRAIDLALGGKAREAAGEIDRIGDDLDLATLRSYSVPIDWMRKTVRPHLTNYRPEPIAPTDLFAGMDRPDAPGAARAQALAARKQGTDSAQCQEQFTRWLTDVYVAAHAAHGHHDAPWDADAKALLASYGHIAGDRPTPEDVAVAKRLLEAKCDDPLVKSVIAHVLMSRGDLQAGNVILEAIPQLEHDYPPHFVVSAFGVLFQMQVRVHRPELAADAQARANQRMIRAAADPIFRGPSRRWFLPRYFGMAGLFTKDDVLFSDDAAERLLGAGDADPWIAQTVAGMHYANQARQARPDDPQRSHYLGLARDHLTKAWEIDPGVPDAAIGMIVVAALTKDPGAPSAREWFERATDLVVDDARAYSTFVEMLRPSTGGSLPAMYSFALECLETGRFDTPLPMWYVWTLQRIQQEVPQPRSVWAARGVAEALDRVFLGYLHCETSWAKPVYIHGGRCATAWAGGRYEAALAAWFDAGKQISPGWGEVIGVDDFGVVEVDLQWLEQHRGK